MARLAHYYHTLRYLQRSQLTGRLRHGWRSRWDNPAKLRHLPAGPVAELRGEPGEFLAPNGSPNDPAELRQGRFRFLNETRELGQPIAWTAPGASTLWQYNLHYHDWLWDLPFAEAQTLARDWLNRVPPARCVAWQPYPVTLRLINWCAYFLGRHRAATQPDAAWREQLWRSFRQHATFLAANLETHVGGNHLLENGAALAFAGAYWAGLEPSHWRELGLRVLRAQLAEQMLDDGVHYERSPMYHTRILWLLTALQASGHAELQAVADPQVHAAARALRYLTHPDGEIALFNDSAFGIYPKATTLLARVGLSDTVLGSFALHNSGFYGSFGATGHYLLCKAGRLGPDHIPGHAHGDLFSFELDWAGHRLITDTGVLDYQAGDPRRLARATASHNTVTVNGQDQGEFWDIFRLARRPSLQGVRFERRPTGFSLEGQHDGYRRLPARVTHRRRFVWDDAGVLLVRDELMGARSFKAAAHLHLHPDCQARQMGEAHAILRLGETVLHVQFTGQGKLHLGESPYYPRFGVALKRQCLIWEAEGRLLSFGFALSAKPELRLDLAKGSSGTEPHYNW